MQECLDYFQKRPAFQKLFEGLKEKYASLGYFGGKVILTTSHKKKRMSLGASFVKIIRGKIE